MCFDSWPFTYRVCISLIDYLSIAIFASSNIHIHIIEICVVFFRCMYVCILLTSAIHNYKQSCFFSFHIMWWSSGAVTADMKRVTLHLSFCHLAVRFSIPFHQRFIDFYWGSGSGIQRLRYMFCFSFVYWLSITRWSF